MALGQPHSSQLRPSTYDTADKNIYIVLGTDIFEHTLNFEEKVSMKKFIAIS